MTSTDYLILVFLLCFLVFGFHVIGMHGEIVRLRHEVRKCLRILYDAVDADPEGGDAE